MLPVFSAFVFTVAFCQHTKTTYLLTRMEESTIDNLFKKKFVSINAENGNPYAKDVYSLKVFDVSKKDNNVAVGFYDNMKDSVPSVNLYNYFQNTTQTLLFLSGKGWELISVTQEISSSYSFERDPTGKFSPVLAVTSKPVYYFKKTINGN